jgi:hypothetical protein
MDEDPRVIADWLMTQAGERWSSAEHETLAGVYCQSHRIGATFGTLEPPEHPDNACGPDCLHLIKSSQWSYEPGDVTIATSAGCMRYEPGLVDSRLGAPA